MNIYKKKISFKKEERIENESYRKIFWEEYENRDF